MELTKLWMIFRGLFLSLTDYVVASILMRKSPIKVLPKPQGPHNVGCRDFMSEYGPDGAFLRLYYPTKQVPSNLQVKWLPHPKYVDGFAKFSRVWPTFFRFVYRAIVGDVYVPVTWKAPVFSGLSGAGRYPLVIFSHGLGGCRTTYSTLCCEIASHGFLVAATEHRDQTACISCYKKSVKEDSLEWIEYRRVSEAEKAYPIRNGQVHQRARECSKALSTLLQLNRGEKVENVLEGDFPYDQFKGLFNENKVSLVGHSFGGATIIPTLTKDQRFLVGVALDAWMYPVRREEMGKVTQPILFVNMEKFQTEVNVSTMKKLGGREGREIVTLLGGSHQNVSDTPFLSTNPHLQAMFQTDHSIQPLLAINLISALTIDFLWKHLDFTPNDEYLKKLRENQKLLAKEVLAITNSKY